MRGLAWYGGPKPTRSGGLVTSVGLNRKLTLAIDPEEKAPPPEPPALPSGPQLVVSPMDGRPAGTELEQRSEPNGRIRIYRAAGSR
jgi:hypothetical protein